MKGLEGNRDASDIHMERLRMRLADAGHAVAKYVFGTVVWGP